MLIAFSGKMQSGKDLACRLVQYIMRCQIDDGFRQNVPMMRAIQEQGSDPFISGWERKFFAYKVKLIASILTGVPVEKFDDNAFKMSALPEEWQNAQCKTYRDMLQRIGTDCMRDHLHANTWVNALFADYVVKGPIDIGKTYSEVDLPNWIITDVRFPNEAAAIRERGGLLIRLERDFEGANEVWRNHPSETSLDDYVFPYKVDNNKDVINLFDSLYMILAEEKIIK